MDYGVVAAAGCCACCVAGGTTGRGCVGALGVVTTWAGGAGVCCWLCCWGTGRATVRVLRTVSTKLSTPNTIPATANPMPAHHQLVLSVLSLTMKNVTTPAAMATASGHRGTLWTSCPNAPGRRRGGGGGGRGGGPRAGPRKERGT